MPKIDLDFATLSRLLELAGPGETPERVIDRLASRAMVQRQLDAAQAAARQTVADETSGTCREP